MTSRRLPTLFATIGFAAALAVGTTSNATAAPALDPNTSISSDGQVGSSFQTAANRTAVKGFKGTGNLADSTGVQKVEGAGPTATPPDFSTQSIIGADGRTQVTNTTTYPARATVYFTYRKPNGATSWCTGWMYAPNAVATAGHCVHSGGTGGAWNTAFTIYPGRNGGSSPYGSCGVSNTYSVLGWTRDNNTEYDYAGFKLNCTIGNTVGWYGLHWQTASLNGTTIFSRGYPQDKASATQWFTSDQVRQSDTRQLRYQLDTVGGQSGSPVYMSGCGAYCGIAVHTTGYGDHNRGTRITQEVFNNYNSWKA